MSRAVAVALAALAGVTAAGCGDNLPVRITVYVPAADASLTAAVREMTSLTGYRGFEIKPVADPRAAVLTGGTLRIAVVTERTCTECYSVDGADFEDRAWVVNGGDLLGAQYGLAHALEN